MFGCLVKSFLGKKMYIPSGWNMSTKQLPASMAPFRPWDKGILQIAISGYWLGGSLNEISINSITMTHIWIMYHICIYLCILIRRNSKRTNGSLADRIHYWWTNVALVDNTCNSMQKDLSWYYMFLLISDYVYVCIVFFNTHNYTYYICTDICMCLVVSMCHFNPEVV